MTQRKPSQNKAMQRVHEELMGRMERGEALSEKMWFDHIIHQNDEATSGIAENEIAPDFSLPDQSGQLRQRADLMGDAGLLLVFARSAHW